MSQATDYTIVSAPRAEVLTDLNSVFGAVQSLNSGSSGPSSIAAMLWADSTSSPWTVKIRSHDDASWASLFKTDGSMVAAPAAHTIASHSDTTGTGAELDTLTDDSMADALHRHSELSASDGAPDPALSVDAAGQVGIGTSTPDKTLELRSASPILRLRDTGGSASATTAFIEFGGTDAGSYTRTGWVGDGSSGNTDISLRAEVSNLNLGDSVDGTALILSGGNATFSGDVDIAGGDLDVTGTIEAGSGNTTLTTTAGLLRHQAIDSSIAGSGLSVASGILSVDSHTIVSHSDTTATGTELNTLTDNSMADALHRHSELSASDGTPD
ncbi:hypothetical protein LCGC14_2017480, partial [marine sediment metagenome]